MKKISFPKLALCLAAAIMGVWAFFGTAKSFAANPPALKEGTYLQGQTLSVWPSWTVLGNALGMALPVDPLNVLGTAGTCATSTNIFCVADTQCPNGEKCVLHDPTTGWSTENRRFSFACATNSYAYRYIDISTSTYEIRARLEDLGITPANWPAFVDSFVSSSVVKFYPSQGICNGDQEVSTISAGKCGDGVVNLINGEECDPPGRIRYGLCGADQPGKVKVDICSGQCKWAASATPYISCSVLSKCGNGIIEPGESCDDGRLNGKYNHCNTTCSGWSALGRCGDGVLQSAYELCDPGTGGDKYAFNRKDSCAWDCQHYGRYCGDGLVEQQVDEIPGALGTVSGGVYLFTSKLGKTIQAREQNTTPTCNYDDGGSRVSCSGNNWTYLINFDQPGSYTIKAVTANAGPDLSTSTANDSACPAPGIQQHLSLAADGTALGNYCAAAVPSPQEGPGYVFNISTAGQHTVTLNWDNDWFDPATGNDSNLKIVKLILIKNIEECDGNKSCTVNGRQGTIFCTSQCKFAYPPDPQDGYCSTTKPAAMAPPGTCGDGVVDPGEACDKGTALNGQPCIPGYGKTCSYCSADCQHVVDVQPTQYCGNGIVEGPEECDVDRNTGYIFRTTTPVCYKTLLFGQEREVCTNFSLWFFGGFDTAHNGAKVATCAEDAQPDYGFKKGTRTCDNCQLPHPDTCIVCGKDADNGVDIGGTLVNVLDPTSANPLLGIVPVPTPTWDQTVSCPGAQPAQTNVFAQCPETSQLQDSKMNLILSPTNTSASSMVYVGGRAWRGNFSNKYDGIGITDRYNLSEKVKVSANGLCSTGDPSYKWQFNDDANPLHWQPFTIIEDKFNDKPWKYDMALSPVITSYHMKDAGDHQVQVWERPNDVRVVISWVGPAEFYGGFAKYASRTNYQLIEGPTIASLSTGVDYYGNPDFSGIWYHGLGFSENQFNEEAFTVDISKMQAGMYAFYVRSASGPLNQLKSGSKLRVDVYVPEADANHRHFARPVKTFYLATAIPSDNAQAAYMQAFNLIQTSGVASADNIMDINEIFTDPQYFTFTASCIGRAGKICRAAWGPCDLPEYCPANDNNGVCPADAYKPAGAYCDDSNASKPCYNQNAKCNGFSTDCPQTLYAPAGTVCGATDEECFNPPSCDGSVFTCPASGSPLPEGTPCGDKCSNSRCSHSRCIAGTPVDCSGNSCKNPTCDPGTGACTYLPIGTACTDSGGHAGTCQFHLGGGDQEMCKCTPTTCAAQGKNCGTIPDGCGGTLNCGSSCFIPVGSTCQNNICGCAAPKIDCGLRCMNCDDANPCTADGCGFTGVLHIIDCIHTPVPDGTSCRRGFILGHCSAGVCV